MTPLSPLVSIIVPSFNEAPDIIRASLESIRNQTFSDFECIVVDESTLPDLAQACSEICGSDPRFIYIHPQKRLGLSASLNLAISIAKGELIARFDSDDICLPERLSTQIEFMKSNPEVGIVGSAMEIMNEQGITTAVRYYPENHADIARKLQYSNAFAHPTVMFRRQVVDRYGSYDANFRFAEDLDLWLRWFKNGVKFANLPNVLVRYRQTKTRRQIENWRYNIKARVTNFDRKLFIFRLIGIFIIGTWMIIPASVQEVIYRATIFRSKKNC